MRPDERNEMGDKNKPQMWRKIRERFCLLPLQQSHFDGLDQFTRSLFPAQSRFWDMASSDSIAQMSPNGDILVCERDFSLAREILQSELDISWAVNIRQVHQQKLNQLRACAQDVFANIDSPRTQRDVQTQWCLTSEAVAAFAPYGLVTRILPDVLRQRADGDAPRMDRGAGDRISYPRHLGSKALVRGVRDLKEALWRLEQNNPLPAAQITAEIRDFCETYLGHGPKSWEVAGYESPRHVRTVLGQGGQATEQSCLPFDTRLNVMSLPAWEEGYMQQPSSWSEELHYWIEQKDIQSTLMRWAFLVAEIPLLTRLSACLSDGNGKVEIGDLFFCTRQEVGSTLPADGEIERRRQIYQTQVKESRPLGGLCEDLGLSPPAPMVVLRGQTASATSTRSGSAWPVGLESHQLPPPAGMVIVASHLSPGLTPFLLEAAAVVVEEGGLLQHAAIIAREMNIPCIVGCRGIVGRVTRGMQLTVDGRSGQVYFDREPLTNHD